MPVLGGLELSPFRCQTPAQHWIKIESASSALSLAPRLGPPLSEATLFGTFPSRGFGTSLDGRQARKIDLSEQIIFPQDVLGRVSPPPCLLLSRANACWHFVFPWHCCGTTHHWAELKGGWAKRTQKQNLARMAVGNHFSRPFKSCFEGDSVHC